MKVTEGRIKMYNEEQCNVYSSENIIRITRLKSEMGAACNMHGENKECVHKYGKESWKEETIRKN
jgi:hypothetical protein